MEVSRHIELNDNFSEAQTEETTVGWYGSVLVLHSNDDDTSDETSEVYLVYIVVSDVVQDDFLDKQDLSS